MKENAELTTQEAADALNISHASFMKLLNEGTLPSHLVGSERRLRAEDILRYRDAEHARRGALLAQLTAEAQEMGFYD